MQNTAVYTVATVGGTLAGGLAVAVLLNRPIRGQQLIRTLMLTPWIVPSFVVALLWQFMWQSDVGIVNKILVDYTGLPRRAAGVAERRGVAVGDHHPLDLARAAVRDADLLRRAAGDPARARARRRRSTAPGRGGASATSRCRCCGR